MALPKQLQQEVEALEQYEKQVAESQQQVTDPPAEQVETPQQAEVKPQEAKQEAPPEAPKKDDWEQRYRSLKGHFDAEVPRLHQQMKSLSQQVVALNQQLEEARTPRKQEPEQRLVTDKDVENFGEDLIDVITRRAQEQLRPLQAELEALRRENASMRDVLGNTHNRVETLTFEQQLNQRVPDFEAVNQDPRWFEWLNEINPGTGDANRVFAQAALDAGNLDKLAYMVDRFKLSLAPTQPTPDRQKELQRQVAPTTTRTSSTPAANTGRIWTRQEYERAFDHRVQRNMSADAAAKMMAEADQAAQEGRVRW